VNPGNQARTDKFEIGCNLQIGSYIQNIVESHPNDQGFTVAAGTYEMAFIVQHYPLVRDASTYWFGYYSNQLVNRWNHVSILYILATPAWSFHGRVSKFHRVSGEWFLPLSDRAALSLHRQSCF
jgi:hypothetical protein